MTLVYGCFPLEHDDMRMPRSARAVARIVPPPRRWLRYSLGAVEGDRAVEGGAVEGDGSNCFKNGQGRSVLSVVLHGEGEKL